MWRAISSIINKYLYQVKYQSAAFPINKLIGTSACNKCTQRIFTPKKRTRETNRYFHFCTFCLQNFKTKYSRKILAKLRIRVYLLPVQWSKRGKNPSFLSFKQKTIKYTIIWVSFNTFTSNVDKSQKNIVSFFFKINAINYRNMRTIKSKNAEKIIKTCYFISEQRPI